MKFGELYRDLTYLFELEAREESFFSRDVVNAINNAISIERLKEVQAGNGSDYTISKEILFTIEDRNMSYLNKTDLDKKLISGVPITTSVITAVADTAGSKITTTPKQWERGDKAIKGGFLYEAVNDIPLIDSSDKTFNFEDIILYVKGKEYNKGDILFYNQTQKYYKVTSDFVSGGDVESEPIVEIYWKKIGWGQLEVAVVKYSKKRDLAVFDYGITINKKALYTTPNITRLFLEYVPEWEWTDEMDKELDLPLSAIPRVKQIAIEQLVPKLGKPAKKEETNS